LGQQERYRKVFRPLVRAGLEVIPDAVPASAVPHVLGYEPERNFSGFLVDYKDPQLVERLNKGWYDLAMSTGLLDENREFLLMLPRATWTAAEDRRRRTMHVWHRVRLLDRWDIMGAGAAAFRGIGTRSRPFPRSPARALEWLAKEDVYKDRELRREVTAWLERMQQR
jgi:hypothetical protein